MLLPPMADDRALRALAAFRPFCDELLPSMIELKLSEPASVGTSMEELRELREVLMLARQRP